MADAAGEGHEHAKGWPAERGKAAAKTSATLADGKRGLQPAKAPVPLCLGPPLDDQQVGDRHRARKPRAVAERQQHLDRGAGQGKQPQRQRGDGGTRGPKHAVSVISISQSADQRRGERSEVESAHNEADVTQAVAGGSERQQNRRQPDRSPIDERERREPRLKRPRVTAVRHRGGESTADPSQ